MKHLTIGFLFFLSVPVLHAQEATCSPQSFCEDRNNTILQALARVDAYRRQDFGTYVPPFSDLLDPYWEDAESYYEHLRQSSCSPQPLSPDTTYDDSIPITDQFNRVSLVVHTSYTWPVSMISKPGVDAWIGENSALGNVYYEVPQSGGCNPHEFWPSHREPYGIYFNDQHRYPPDSGNTNPALNFQGRRLWTFGGTFGRSLLNSTVGVINRHMAYSSSEPLALIIPMDAVYTDWHVTLDHIYQATNDAGRQAEFIDYLSQGYQSGEPNSHVHHLDTTLGLNTSNNVQVFIDGHFKAAWGDPNGKLITLEFLSTNKGFVSLDLNPHVVPDGPVYHGQTLEVDYETNGFSQGDMGTLYLQNSHGVEQTLAQNLPLFPGGRHTFSWPVTTQERGPNTLLITAESDSVTRRLDYYFNLQEPTLTLNSPAGTQDPSIPLPIVWYWQGEPTTVNLRLYRDTTDLGIIAQTNSLPGTNRFDWVHDLTPGNCYYIAVETVGRAVDYHHQGLCFEIGPVNQAPDINIQQPFHGQVFDPGEVLFLEGSAQDLEDGDLSQQLQWYALGTGLKIPLGNGANQSLSLPHGDWQITATATDGHGDTGSETVDITVLANMRITTPQTGDNFSANSLISFQADPGDGTNNIYWKAYKDRPDRATPLGRGTSVSIRLTRGLWHIVAARPGTFSSNYEYSLITINVN